MSNLADKLNALILARKAPIVVGLDPVISRIPDVYKQGLSGSARERTVQALLAFNRDIIDAVCDIVPAVKPQMAFYEMYGSAGVAAFEQTTLYAHEKGLIVIDDSKRNDIGNTAAAYAAGHLGTVESIDGPLESAQWADFLTVSSYLGFESFDPFVKVATEHDKGVFFLVKTSNTGNATVQEALTADGCTVSEAIAGYIARAADATMGDGAYSSVGAVIGATYPGEAAKFRALMPHSIFLVPGYGAQGAGAADVMGCFNPDGLGALINSSRGIIFAYEKMIDAAKAHACTREQYRECTRAATQAMRDDLYATLKATYPQMRY